MFRYRLMMAYMATWMSCTCTFLHGDQLSPATLLKVKKATVFIRAAMIDGEGQGSGFFVADNMIVTNAHVLGMKDKSAQRPNNLSLVLNSGEGAKEKVISGEVVFADTIEDLAFIKVVPQAGITPLELVPSEDVLETLPVHIVGYPLGAALTSGNNPAVTVATGSVSSIRRNKNSQIEELQIDGSIIPGNSGGPIVDAKGRLVGVSVATILGTQIGFSIPADSVRADMEGRVESVSLTHKVHREGVYSVDARIRVIDPMERIGAVAIYYWYSPLNTERPLDPEGKFPTHGAQTDSPKKHVRLVFDHTSKQWTGTIPEFQLREDQDIWLQPAVGSGRKVRLTGALNYSTDLRQKAQSSNVVVNSGEEIDKRHDRRKDEKQGRSTAPATSPNASKLGKVVPKESIPTIRTDDSSTLNATIERDESGQRFTLVNSTAEKITLSTNRLIQMVSDPTGRVIYAIFRDEPSLKVFDTKDMSLAREIPVAKDPVAIWCDHSRIVVACDKSKTVAVIDSNTYATRKVIRLANRELVPFRLPGMAPDGTIMSLWRAPDAARSGTLLYLLDEKREPIEFAKEDIEWCAFTGFKDYLWTQCNFRGSPSGVANVIADEKPDRILSQQSILSSIGSRGLHRDTAHSFPTHDGKGFVVPISTIGMKDASVYSARTMIMSPDLSKIELWIPGSVICEVPSQGVYVSWQGKVTKENPAVTAEILYVSSSDGRIVRRITVNDLTPHPAGYIIRNAIPNIVYVPGREYFLFHEMNSQTGEIDLVRCGPVSNQFVVPLDPSLRAIDEPPQIAYVDKAISFTPSFDSPKAAKKVIFRLKKGVQGMEVDSETGKISFKPTETTIGLYDIELVADVDGTEVPVIKWTLEIDFAP